MSFTLKEIELNNIRVHEHLVFEPSMSGVTAISGDTGAGKSTIVDSLAWALYGTRPNNIRNKLLIREGVDPREHKVSARVVIISGDTEYTIERKLTSADGAAECNVWSRKSGSDKELEHIAGPAVSHVERFIRRTLSLNEKGFLTSVFIQQKQVDQIVSASPRERGLVIEDMTGISKITQAIDLSNEQMRDFQKTLKVMPSGNVDEATNKVELQSETLKSLIDKRNELGAQFKLSKEEIDSAEVLVETERKKIEQADKLNNEIEQAKSTIAIMESQMTDDIEVVQSYKSRYSTMATFDVGENKQVRDKAQSSLNSIKVKAEAISVKYRDIVNMKNNIEKLQYKDSEEVLELISTSQENISNLEESLKHLEDERVDILANRKKSRDSLAQLSSGEDIHACPVCKNEIKNPEELREEIARELELLVETDKQNKSKTIEAKALLEKELETKGKLEEVASKLLELVVINETLLPQAEAEVNKVSIEVAECEALLSSAEATYELALKSKADADSFDVSSKRMVANSKKVNELKTIIETNESLIQEVKAMNNRSFSSLSKQLGEKTVRLNKLRTQGQAITGEVKLAKERLNDFKSNLSREKEMLERYTDIAQQVSELNATSVTLSEFKRSHIESSIPMLEFYASDFLSKFTGGTFVRMNLDERFNASVVTDTGITRPIPQLSGGELSSAAIALRLGISLLLNGRTQGLVILDEVLVSMDQERAQQIMETIASITNSQVIFIAHNTAINAIADKTVHIKRG